MSRRWLGEATSRRWLGEATSRRWLGEATSRRWLGEALAMIITHLTELTSQATGCMICFSRQRSDQSPALTLAWAQKRAVTGVPRSRTSPHLEHAMATRPIAGPDNFVQSHSGGGQHAKSQDVLESPRSDADLSHDFAISGSCGPPTCQRHAGRRLGPASTRWASRCVEERWWKGWNPACPS